MLFTVPKTKRGYSAYVPQGRHVALRTKHVINLAGNDLACVSQNTRRLFGPESDF